MKRAIIINVIEAEIGETKQTHYIVDVDKELVNDFDLVDQVQDDTNVELAYLNDIDRPIPDELKELIRSKL